MIDDYREYLNNWIDKECYRRIEEVVPEFDTIQEVTFLDRIWPLLNTDNIPDDLATVRAIFLYAKDKKQWVNKNKQEYLNKYKPDTDTGWPS